jgi:hypothetical protein
MVNKFFSIGLFVLFISTVTFGQHNFDSIKICHDKEGKLKFIDAGEYKVVMQNGMLLSLSSKDDVINYEESKKLFIIKNLGKGDFFEMRLSREGPVLSTKDTSFLLNSPESVHLEASKGTGKKEALYSLGGFSFVLDFTNNKISRITFASTNKYVVINLVQIGGVYTWDFGIESSKQANKLLLAYAFNKPYLLSVYDDSNKVGVRLFSKKKNGILNLLEGLKKHGSSSFYSDRSYELQYANSGKIKNNASKFDLSCKY